MAYDTAVFDKNINLTEASRVFSESLESEKVLCDVFLDSAPDLLKKMYGVEIDTLKQEMPFDYSEYGLFRFRADFWIETKCGQKILIECKNPTHQFRENLIGIAQVMSYKMAFDHAGGIVDKYLFVTSVFTPFILKFISDYNVPIDVLLLKNREAGFWSYKKL